ncbi:MAG: hypothetical protein ACOC4G_09005 [Bacillota bacterium]
MVEAGIICPEKSDFNYCRDIFGLNKIGEIAKRKVGIRELDSVKIIAVNAGTGKINCASTTQMLIDRYDLDVVVDSGRAGGLREEFNIPTVVAGLKSFEYDIIQDKELDKISGKHISETMVACLDNTSVDEFRKEKEYNNIVCGNIACGEKNVNNSIMRDLLFMKLNAFACNRETSAVIKTAFYNDIPSLSFRVITNYADANSKDDDYKYKKEGLEYLYEIIGKFLTSEYGLNLFE